MEDVIVNELIDWIKSNCPFLKLSLSEFYILIRYITFYFLILLDRNVI